MSMTTSLRYEVENPSAKTLRQALQRQQTRIKNDQEQEMRESQVRLEKRINEVSEWAEKLEEAAEKRMLKIQADEISREMTLSNKALTALRRAGLRKQLEQEYSQYERELNAIGKSFYKLRV